MKMSPMHWVAKILLLVGGLNWGLVGFFGFNLVDSIFGAGSLLSGIIYDLVGLSALYMIIGLFMMKKHHEGGQMPMPPAQG